jgi:hypothetical protein
MDTPPDAGKESQKPSPTISIVFAILSCVAGILLSLPTWFILDRCHRYGDLLPSTGGERYGFSDFGRQFCLPVHGVSFLLTGILPVACRGWLSAKLARWLWTIALGLQALLLGAVIAVCFYCASRPW